MTVRHPHPALAWSVWGVAVTAYAVAIINRTSLAALGPATQEHFGIDATTLATFAMLQLVVYAVLQIPVGTLLDRWGSSVMLVLGGVLMTIGQLVMATVSDVSLALLARVLVGAGDACIFISVIRVLPSWFGVRQLPTVTQLTGVLGQAGQLVSVVPLAWAVAEWGWMPAFSGVAAAGFLSALLVAFVVRDTPATRPLMFRVFGARTQPEGPVTKSATVVALSTEQIAVGPPATALFPLPTQSHLNEARHPESSWIRGLVTARRVLSNPGLRLAYWIHFTLPFSLNVFVLLWGTPFMVGGLGMSTSQAASLLSIVVVSTVFGGIVLGPLSTRFAAHRVIIAVIISLLGVLAWTTVLLWPGEVPYLVMIALMFFLSVGGPGSMIAFEVVRSHTPIRFTGFATGLVNTAGFTSSLLVIMLIGFVLDWLGAGSPETYTKDAFVLAFCVQFPFWALGIGMILWERNKTTKLMRQQGRRLS